MNDADEWDIDLEDGPSAKRGPRRRSAESSLVRELVMELVVEKRRSRRWSIFFKSLTFLYIFALLVMVLQDTGEWTQLKAASADHVALLDIDGIIAAGAEANADDIVTGLRAAYESRHTRGVILRLNTPGGSPVQAGYVYNEVRRLKELHPDIPVYAVAVDLCASAGYYIAAAADEIYADPASLVGSIGVLMDGFGFVDTLKLLGMERRLMTAGESKGIMDPFSPIREQDKVHLQSLLNELHQQFIRAVKAGRGKRLAEQPSQPLFTGLFWTGAQAQEMGLVDGLGSSSYVARELIGVEEIVDYSVKSDWMKRLSDRLGSSLLQGLQHGQAALSGWMLK